MQVSSLLSLLLLTLFLLFPLPLHAIVGPCIYNTTHCSCKFGASNSGTCYDLVSATSPERLCTSRFCHAGWTCACANRTNLCTMRERSTLIPTNSRQQQQNTVTCQYETRYSAADGDRFSLGTFRPAFSKKGLEAGACGKLSWWLDGELMANYGGVTESSVLEELDKRQNNTLLHLKQGSLIAFRFKDTSYHCYNSMATFMVNGTAIDTLSSAVSTRFARGFVPNWFLPSTSLSYADEEATAGTYDFVPLRTHMLSDGSPIPHGVDSWRSPDGTADHKISNFYFRIQL